MNYLLDVDGVLADFDTAARRVLGVSDADMDKCKGDWHWPLKLGMTMDEFWKPIDTYQFWRYKVRPYRGARAFVKKLRTFGPVMFCTTPSHNPESLHAKVAWLREHIGPANTMDYIICGTHKHWLARRGTVLIDDKSENCEDFKLHGGGTILVPQPWNGLHDRPGVRYGKADYKYICNRIEQSGCPEGEWNNEY